MPDALDVVPVRAGQGQPSGTEPGSWLPRARRPSIPFVWVTWEPWTTDLKGLVGSRDQMVRSRSSGPAVALPPVTLPSPVRTCRCERRAHSCPGRVWKV